MFVDLSWKDAHIKRTFYAARATYTEPSLPIGTTICDTSRAYGNAAHAAVYLSLLTVFPTWPLHHLRVSLPLFLGISILKRISPSGAPAPFQVLGSYWKGRMSNEEANSLYLCTVRDYHALHSGMQVVHPLKQWSCRRWCVDGQGSRETGGSASDRIFFMQ